jgi:Ca-activated chloride channel family protein
MKLRIADCRLRIVTGIALIVVIAGSSFGDEVYSKNKKGNELYKKGNYDGALKLYDDALLMAPADSLLKMNRGSALYRLGKFSEAESTYTPVVSMKDRKKLADAHYNMGNILFKEGDQLMASGGQDAGEKFKAALEHYIASLDLQSTDKNSKWNIELTQRRIKQQERQQKQNQDKNKDQNKQDKKQDQNKDQKQNDKNKQDQDKQDKNKDNQDKKQDQKDKQDQNKDQQSQNDHNKQQPPQPQPRNSKDDMKKEEAKRLIEQFADDADTLNKPQKKQGVLMRMHKPEKDW